MESIALVTVSGSTFFVQSDAIKGITGKIDAIAEKMPELINRGIVLEDNEIFSEFVKIVSQQTNVDLSKVDLSHVYRINI